MTNHFAAPGVPEAVPATGEAFQPETQSPNEQIAQTACQELLASVPGYQGTFSFGTPGGNDLDLRLCFENVDEVEQEQIRSQLVARLRADGVSVDLDIFFMSGQEFQDGIRDLVELGSIEQHLEDGFDSHQDPVAVGDMSMFSLYIFSTMRTLHLNPAAGSFGSPQQSLDRLVLTPDGAVGWMHYYTGCFLHEYLTRSDAEQTYIERLAKFSSRVISGSTLAQLELPQLATIKPELISAIQRADATTSTDATMTEALLTNPGSVVLLSVSSQDLLQTAGAIRSGNRAAMPPNFIQLAEAELFYAAFQQGIHRRNNEGDGMDSLTAYALGELIQQLGSREVYEPGGQAVLMRQGEPSRELFYLPLKTADKQQNGSVAITVQAPDGSVAAQYQRRAGVLGEGALFDLPRSATVSTTERVEAYKIDIQTIRNLLTNPGIFQELQNPLLQTLDARRVDILLRHLAIQAGIFTRQTLPYTNLAPRETAQQALGDNPLAQYNLGQGFHDSLQALAQPAAGEAGPVTTIATDETHTQTLFTAGQTIDRLYVVSSGSVSIPLQNGETITLNPGEFFGESSILGLPTTGTAILSQNSQVLAVEAAWFKRFTQSRRPIPGTNTLPVHLLYHLAAEGYDRVRRRLVTQRH